METKELFNRLLHLPEEWEVYEVTYEETQQQIHLKIRYLKKEGVCKMTGEICSIYDYRPERQWRHLDLMGYKTYLYCCVPRVKNSLGNVSSIPVPWANDEERHTHEFENYAIKLLQATHNQTKAGELLDVSYEKINRVMSNSVERGLARRELSSEKIISINIDEKSYKKGHNYITVISQQTRNRVLEVGKERTLEATESLLNTTFTEEQLTDQQRAKFMEINQANLLTSRAWKMRENFMEIFEKQTTEEASLFFESWYENVVKSNIAPMKKAAKTLKSYKQGILNIIKYNLSNARAERFNGAIQKLNRVAQGYRNFDNLRIAILFFNGKLNLFSHY